jgi:predicted permease
MRTDLGFDREHILTVVLDSQSAGLQPRQLPEFYNRLVERVKSTPGVRNATVSLSSLAGGGERSGGIYVPGYTPQSSEAPRTVENFVSPGYFAVMGMRLLQGRDFDGRDGADAPPVAIINEAFARRYFSGRNPLGRRFGYSAGHSGFEIVGVIADARTSSPKEPAHPMSYRPLNQEMQYARSLEVLTEGDPRAHISQIRRVISEAAPNLPIVEVTALSDRVERTFNQERLLNRITSFFATVALLLACMGVYGLVSYGVARRTAEFGIRMALGARNIHVVRIVLFESLLLLVMGLGIGLGSSIAGAGLLRSLLFGLSSNDPLILVVAALLTSVVAILSACLPSGRQHRSERYVKARVNCAL